MAYDYDKLYGETRDALGQPTSVFVDFFDRFDQEQAGVLDVGCGQGRDALFVARKGHNVVGVDISPNGIRDLKMAAEQENLPIQGIVADITAFSPEGEFDIVLFDRTLHMLPRTTRIAALAVMLDHDVEGGWVLIADETSNIEDFQDVMAAHRLDWITNFRKQGYLFVRRS